VFAVGYCPVKNQQLNRDGETIDVASLLEAFDNNRSLLAQIIELFLRDLPVKIERLHASVATGDDGEIFTAIHTITGSVGMLWRGNAYDAALALERDAQRGAMGDAAARSVDIEYQLTRLASALDAILTDLRAQ
jgi:hypothetical protein